VSSAPDTPGTTDPVTEPTEEPYLDLSAESPSTDWAPSADAYDPNPKREQVRGTIAWVLLGIFGATILFSFMALAFKWGTHEEIQDMLGILLPPVVGLVGSAIGFYFGRDTA
jgi:uncharacterized membrane protein YeaQ/YmgE (transglycosylase-associated protein family)